MTKLVAEILNDNKFSKINKSCNQIISLIVHKLFKTAHMYLTMCYIKLFTEILNEKYIIQKQLRHTWLYDPSNYKLKA